MTASPQIVRRSLTDELVTRLRDMIIAGDLAAGLKVPEAELCQRFGVSRTPLREALKVLAAEGLVVLALNRGATVAKITASEIEELFPIMGSLEALAGELACTRIDADSLARLEKLHEQMRGEFERGDWLAYSKLNRQIHEALFEIAGNAALSALYQQLLVRIHAVRFVARKTPERWQEAIDDHEKIMTALRARDASLLAAALRQHLRHKADSVQEGL
jgi:DNA-binding GntR family transcriptional regulator